MADNASRREFLRNASLAGAALAAGGTALTAGGCGWGQVHVDRSGVLVIDDGAIADQLYDYLSRNNLLIKDPSGEENTKACKGIIVHLMKKPKGGGEFKVNSLCLC